MTLSIIIVSYNTNRLLKICLDSVNKYSNDINYEIIVVDNNSGDNSVELLKSCFPRVVIIENSVNVGFAKAVNQALEISRGKYKLLLNSDTEICSNILKTMITFMNCNQQVGVVGCRLRNLDGTIQRSTFGFPTLLKEFVHLASLDQLLNKILSVHGSVARFLGKLFGRNLYRYGDYNKMREVDFVSAACLMVRDEVIQKIGYMDGNFFMYMEEADWCYRIKKEEWKIIYIPKGDVIHLGKSSIKDNLNEVFYQRYINLFYFYKKHGGTVIITLFRIMIFIGFIVRVGLISLFAFKINVGKSELIRKRSVYYKIIDLVRAS